MIGPTDTNIVVEQEAEVLWVQIVRPQQHNALSLSMLDAIGTAFREATPKPPKLAVITGAGAASFAAGGDLKELDKVRSESQTQTMSQRGMAALNAIRDFPAPVVAALNGSARGGGAELALACDLRLAAPSARFGLIQGRLALSTAWGGGTDLMELMGPSKALLTLGQASLLDASQALAAGLVDRVLLHDPEDSALVGSNWRTQVLEALAPLLARPSQVLRAHKALAQVGVQQRQVQQQVETEQLVATWTHEDHWLAAASAFDKTH
jgi:enoyl-CoA hydratase